MSDASSWWARQLGGAPAAPTAPTQPQPAAYPQKAVRWQPAYPPTGPRQEMEYGDQPGSDPDDNWHRVRRQGYVDKAPSSIGKDGRCPDCGGSNYFHRKGPMGVEAAPLCTDCGYNGDLFTQSGTLLTAIGAKSTGPVQFARSDNPDAISNFGEDPGLRGTDFSWGNVR